MARTKEFNEHMILEKAMRLFWEKGYNGTSAQDLVEGLGISRSSMYDTFGDKHSLFVKALTQYRIEKIDPVLQEANTTEDVETFIRNAFELVKVESLQKDRFKGCFMVNSAVELATVDPEVVEIARAIMEDTENAICTAIKRGQAEGVFTKDHPPRALARFIFNSLNGLRVTVKFDASKKAFDDIVNICLAAIRK